MVIGERESTTVALSLKSTMGTQKSNSPGIPFINLAISLIIPLMTLSSAVGTSFYPPCRRIDAAVRWASTNVTYFFSAEEFITYHDIHNAQEDEPLPVRQIARNFPSSIDAAVSWFSRRRRNSRSFYFSGCFYHKVSERTRRVQSRHRLSRLRLPCDVDAAVNTDGHTILVFKGCQYWTITRTNRRAVLGGSTSDLGLPCDVDAALTWENGTSYVIKADVIWALSSSNQSVEFQTSLDEWNLCSWRICELEGHDATTNHTLEGSGFPCNGDPRFCSLRFDQLTMAGSHNAGAGFDGGFGFFSCWVRNQYLTVLEQLRFGVRFLDVDTSWEHCGTLGSFHNFMCGGPVCKMIKQIKQFLRENRHEVVAINFNHEMRDTAMVLPALVRQLTSQLGNYVNSAYRDVGEWPLLGDAVRSDRRLFVVMDPRVTSETRETYLRHRWIHSERLLRSTWRGDVNVGHDCREVVENSREQCQARQDAPLLEISILGYSTGCVTSIADLCLPLVHQISQDCQQHRHQHGKAPNVLLVDFPERVAHNALSVASAAFLQNVRNVFRLASLDCRLGVDAAVWLREEEEEDGGDLAEEEGRVVFFRLRSPPRSAELVVYRWALQTQDREESVEYAQRLLPPNVDAAFRLMGQVCFVSGCDVTCLRGGGGGGGVRSQEMRVTSSANMTTWGLPCHVDAALTNEEPDSVAFFKGCHYWTRLSSGTVTGPEPITDFGLPCDVSAAFRAPDGAAYFFKGDHYWRHSGGERGLSPPAHSLEWSADFVQCQMP
ncbi:uncharacterized protein LOC143276196 isoform X2 [Babylonia areolata]|uniref:uncharacterized protein LOC143276196 isoform X2 n=1 Tax=Babylonia areolata TaxID=304850 RepID=UPI003FD6640D